MTVQRMSLTSLLAQPLDFVLTPPAFRFYMTHGLALLASLGVVIWTIWDAQGGFELIHWVGVLFGGAVLLMSLWPASWNRQRFINLAFDEQHLYLVNGNNDEAVAVPRERVCAVNKDKLPGHDGAIIAFSIDLSLNEAELAQVQDTLDAKVEERFQLGDERYRFGFVANWQRRRQLLTAVSVLAPIVVEPEVIEEDWD
ncbi:hypothetical protein [Oceanisphaera pacifica]|uniref:Uncharacterized protein n=1 Tax=Oceanisphaera pacifica TaxID=2818389 RepID=A0ABS3NFZ5_9GAMM|nr:hypothetical protein [Oceanisphaera pacifica]MBO1519506.1 hypothetical protein [Oceanisphaera pacifica]